MGKKNKLDVSGLMGEIVLVDHAYARAYFDNNRKGWTRGRAEGRPGWVVGERWLQTGCVCEGDYEYEYEAGVASYCTSYPNVFHEEEKRKHCLLVCYWPTMKPEFVPSDRDIKYPEPSYRLAPKYIKPYFTGSPWTPTCRDMQREYMEDWPRDAKGRWTKLPHNEKSPCSA